MGIEQQFERDGYLVTPNVLNPEQVHSLRKLVKEKFSEPDKRLPGDSYGDNKYKAYSLVDIYNRYPEVRWLLFQESVQKVLKTLLGDDYVETPECSFSLNLYSPWHKDTTSLERAGYRFHYQGDFRMVGLAYYLQDNTEEHGGGLDVEPGSHRDRFDKFISPPPPPGLARRAVRKLGRMAGIMQESHVSIPSKAGDLVLFHYRMCHRATPAKSPPAQDKIAIFDGFSRNRPYLKEYMDFIHSKDGWEYIHHVSYRPDFLKQARAAGVGLALENYARQGVLKTA